MTKPELASQQPDPKRDQMLKLLADLNAKAQAAGGVGFGFFIDGEGHTYFQASTDLDNNDQPQLP